jgi:hypothetical protein
MCMQRAVVTKWTGFILLGIEPSVGHLLTWRMLSSGQWRCVGLVRTDVSEELVASSFRVYYPRVKKIVNSWLTDCLLVKTFFIVTAVKTSNSTFAQMLGNHLTSRVLWRTPHRGGRKGGKNTSNDVLTIQEHMTNFGMELYLLASNREQGGRAIVVLVYVPQNLRPICRCRNQA